MEQELALSRENFERSKSLFNEALFPGWIWCRPERLHPKQYSFESVKTSRTNSKLQITQLEQNIMEMEMTIAPKKTPPIGSQPGLWKFNRPNRPMGTILLLKAPSAEPSRLQNTGVSIKTWWPAIKWLPSSRITAEKSSETGPARWGSGKVKPARKWILN